MTRAEEFEALRPLLFSIAYPSPAALATLRTPSRRRGCATTAHLPRCIDEIVPLAVVTRISIDLLRSARVRREEYVGEWLPEPLLNDPYQEPERAAELADSVSMAALLLLERLSPWSARSSCCARCSASTTPRSHLPWAARRQPAASLR